MTNSRHELNKYTIGLNFFESRISILIFLQFHEILSKLSIFHVKKNLIITPEIARVSELKCEFI